MKRRNDFWHSIDEYLTHGVSVITGDSASGQAASLAAGNNQPKPPMRKGIYIITDHVTQDMAGNGTALFLYAHEAAAVRMFNDAARMPNSQLAAHPDDHALVRLGWLEEDLTITADNKTILEGSVWAANLVQEKQQ